MDVVHELDLLIENSLGALATDEHARNWNAKENDWVSYFTFRYLLQHCRSDGVIRHPAQIAIEVGVGQPKSYGAAKAVRRDIVIWPEEGMTCWDKSWEPVRHPLAIIEWKVHRVGRKNRLVERERQWLRSYCREHLTIVCYAIEVDGTTDSRPITCSRFFGHDEIFDWRSFDNGP
jgi:hypothetical protein